MKGKTIMEIGTPREQVCMNYHVDSNGIIRSPGKFEGQSVYVPYFWDIGLEGFADSDDGRVYSFKLTKEDRSMFPELPKRKRVLKLVENEQGFVSEI